MEKKSCLIIRDETLSDTRRQLTLRGYATKFPELEGWEPYWVARIGFDATRVTYRPTDGPSTGAQC